MTWQTVALMTLTDEWQYTNPVPGTYFRLSHSIGSFNTVLLTQAQQLEPDTNPTKYEHWQYVRTWARPEPEIIEFEIPPFFPARCLGLRKTHRLAIPWTITLEVWTVPFSPVEISLNIPVADNATLTEVAASTEWTQLVAANSNRKGLIIHNASSAELDVRFGDSAPDSAAIYLQPYQQYELPVAYTGKVEGKWDAADGEARITQFV